jgi:hypothetical protein
MPSDSIRQFVTTRNWNAGSKAAAWVLQYLPKNNPILLVLLRLWRGIADHFVLRATDWFAAAFLMSFGLTLLRPADTFAISQSYRVMATMAPEWVWGVGCTSIATVRLVALFVNGTFPSFRWSPHIRALGTFLSIFAWAQIAIGLTLANTAGTGAPHYQLLVLFECYNMFLTASEAGIAERRWRASNGGGS